jgi:hypothetical protein
MSILEPYIGNGVTYGNQLHEIGTSLFGPSLFRGVYAADELPDFDSKHHGYYCIVNLDKSYESGSHWIAMAKKDSRCPTYFYDSFGRHHADIMAGLDELNVKSTELDAEQSKRETNCGLRCMAWLCVFHVHGCKVAATI